jgi:hypothetical protein
MSTSSRAVIFDLGDGCASQASTAGSGTPPRLRPSQRLCLYRQAHKATGSLDVPGATRSLEMRPGQAPNRAGRSPRRVKRVYLRPIHVTRRPSSPPWLSACDSRQPTPTLRSRKAALDQAHTHRPALYRREHDVHRHHRRVFDHPCNPVCWCGNGQLKPSSLGSDHMRSAQSGSNR